MTHAPATPPCWLVVLGGAMAGALGWGIRGQYGHETGAMMAGLLLGLTLVVAFCRDWPLLSATRAAAWCAIAIGFGGSMTYGQTVGLTHDAPLVGNGAALAWGMLGLAIKGSLWIGFAAAFLGMGLGGVSYSSREIALLMLGLLLSAGVGIAIFNRPLDPAQQVLPAIYFSHSWHWMPGTKLKPRPEVWGGLLVALVVLSIYTRAIRQDRLACRMAGWGVLAGAIGFPLGQSLQAWHAWNVDYLRQGWWANIDPIINWWNFMETTFGATMGAVVSFGLWLNRGLILQPRHPTSLPVILEGILLLIHLPLLLAVEFLSVGWIDRIYDFGMLLCLIPIVAVASGRWWPFLVLLPVTLLPIVGKTVRRLAYEEHALSVPLAWIVYLAIPLVLASGLAVYLAKRRNETAGRLLPPVLLFCTWIYFGLNFAFFRFPWPWQGWTMPTPNAIVFTLCAIGLSACVCASWWKRSRPPESEKAR